VGHPELLQDVDIFTEGMVTEYEAIKMMEKFVKRVLSVEETFETKKSPQGTPEKEETKTQPKEKETLRPSSGVLDMIQPSRKSGQTQP
jgi:hypothetical protein